LPIGLKEEVVKKGTGAMRVYQDMMFGVAKEDVELRERHRALLLQYCELDTKAMVFIWMHWQRCSEPSIVT
jgi:tRNA A37 N6-isopentenylltransferase MiaA